MRGPSCVWVGILLERRAAGLSEGERLQIERHLVGCPSCSGEAAALDGMASLLRAAPLRVAGSTDTLIAAAFREVEARRQPAPARWQPWPALAVGVLALTLVALVAAGVRSVLRSPSAPPAPSTPMAVVPKEPSPTAAAGPVPSLPSGDGGSRAFSAEAGAELTLDEVRLLVVQRATLDWSAGTSTVRIDEGTVRLKIPARTGGPFRIATARFVVEVIGTELEVGPGHVEMLEGTVRVVAPDGAMLVEALRAPSYWSPGAPPPVSEERRPQVSKPAPAPSAAALLALGRRHLAKRRLDEARRAISRALTLGPTRAQRAEGLTLLAECAQSAGQHQEAARRYAEVARDHADLAAGEIALFAAGRLEVRLQNLDRARAHLRAYLARYPTGRFRREATDHLSRLEKR